VDANSRERGAAAVEMALLLPLLMVLVFGIIDFTRILGGLTAAQQGAREGARLAALAPNYDWSTVVKPRAEAASKNPFASPATTATLATAACDSASKPDTVQVNVSFMFNGILFYGSGHTFTGEAVMRCGG